VTIVFPGPTRYLAWLQAAEHLLEHSPDLNLILNIDTPLTNGTIDPRLRSEVDAFLLDEGQQPLHTIAETIFPGWAYRTRGIEGVFQTYPKEYAAFKSRNHLAWGTYAHRLVHRRSQSGEILNPLRILIRNMKTEIQHERGGTFKSRYELGVSDSDYDIALYSTIDDQGRRRQLPCLSHLSFKLHGGRVHLTAIFLSHEYRYKALGNLLGLARLQACVAREVGLKAGALVIHSTFAFLDRGRGKRRFKELLDRLRTDRQLSPS